MHCKGQIASLSPNPQDLNSQIFVAAKRYIIMKNLETITEKHGNAMANKVKIASELYDKHFGGKEEDKVIAVAPGRVNLIGEHTDYTGGFVLPFAIDYACVVYGTGSMKQKDESEGSSTISLDFVSSQYPESVAKFTLSSESVPPEKSSWTTYVLGTVFQYLSDVPKSMNVTLKFSIVSDVPLGSGLSSSASLEVSVARFFEAILGDSAFTSEEDTSTELHAKIRALRCQKAENVWCHSPCGIMDQYVSSAASSGSLLLIDCTSLEAIETKMADQDDTPVLVVANSNVKHDIGGGEYPIRVKQCKTATEALQKVNSKIQTLRNATSHDVEKAKEFMDSVSYRRARHVVTENTRVLDAKKALESGDWIKVGLLMNDSHTSMRFDYEVSCDEIDLLVSIAQSFSGVYGSRLTGGGFGGCTVSFVQQDRAEALMEELKREYKAKLGKDCDCFQTQPARGAHILEV